MRAEEMRQKELRESAKAHILKRRREAKAHVQDEIDKTGQPGAMFPFTGSDALGYLDDWDAP